MPEGAKSKVPLASNVTEPFATVIGVPTTAAMPSMPVIVAEEPSNESLVSTGILTVVSSFVVIASSAISTTAATVTLTVDDTRPPLPSLAVTTKLSLPL
ncbi:hypothetical protein D3C72_1389170 [compost metagenome]